MTDEESMGKWFARVTKPQLNEYNSRMGVAAAYRGAPRWDRERAAAQREFHEATAEARRLYETAMDELSSLGEITEATDYALTQFDVGAIVTEAPLSPDLEVIRSCLERTS
ncbi:hypothetical protein [Bradyrhizobium icense]|uniref:Uncharacterized protein n=1 Tax=Bradyrhizobium icense TaxID=1274631 RepID=A0A1B1UD29_9BRAD|nr:hypothetical protein [Bradyrhizobium icense]ANW00665.1 hypothetical protein LMTR13_11300 [Bradyrhizobium icense]